MGRARRSWFKVASSVYREPWDDSTLATFVRLSAYLNDRWARDGLSADEACRAILTRGDMHRITGRAQLRHSRSTMSALCVHVSCTMSARGEHTEIYWPKFAEFQGMRVHECTSKVRHAVRSTQYAIHSPSESALEPEKPVVEIVPDPPAPVGETAIAPEGLAFTDCRPLVNILAKHPGDDAAKLAWLDANIELIVNEVAALGLPTKQQNRAKLRAFIIRYYRQHTKPEAVKRSRVESFDDARARRNAAWTPTEPL